MSVQGLIHESLIEGKSIDVDLKELEILGDFAPRFKEWLSERTNYPSSKYMLERIGYADECHRRNRHWKPHLYLISSNRLNITKEFGVRDVKPEELEDILKKNKKRFDFLKECGFTFVLYFTIPWRRGTDIKLQYFSSVDEIKIDSEKRVELFVDLVDAYNRVELFLINNHSESSEEIEESPATEISDRTP